MPETVRRNCQQRVLKNVGAAVFFPEFLAAHHHSFQLILLTRFFFNHPAGSGLFLTVLFNLFPVGVDASSLLFTANLQLILSVTRSNGFERDSVHHRIIIACVY